MISFKLLLRIKLGVLSNFPEENKLLAVGGVYKIKLNFDGFIDRHKACLVVQELNKLLE
jgi:hypothetical protein